MNSCSVDGCKKPVKVESRRLCSAHYQRWYTHGNPLGGRKTMTGEPERYFREVVLAYEGDDCLCWPYSWAGRGYGTLNGQYVHRLVCEYVNGEPPTPEHEAAHSCGKGHLACVTKGHLSWKTHIGNMADTIEHGTRSRGERNSVAKLTEADVRKILSLKGSAPQREIAIQFRVTQQTVSDICRGKRWAWLT